MRRLATAPKPQRLASDSENSVGASSSASSWPLFSRSSRVFKPVIFFEFAVINPSPFMISISSLVYGSLGCTVVWVNSVRDLDSSGTRVAID
ncbi:hypothetical protein CsSME_00001064 [Camellia sinensis var. sinensis]